MGRGREAGATPRPPQAPLGAYSASHSSPREAQQGPEHGLKGPSFDEGGCTTLGDGVTQRESRPPGGDLGVGGAMRRNKLG